MPLLQIDVKPEAVRALFEDALTAYLRTVDEEDWDDRLTESCEVAEYRVREERKRNSK